MADDSIVCHGWTMRKTVHALALPVALLLALGLSACDGGQVPVSEPTGSDEAATSADDDSSQKPTEKPTSGKPSGKPTAEGRSVHASDLQVGDCYNDMDAGSTGSNGERQVGNVEVVDCEVPHQHEVYNNYQITLSAFPDKSTMGEETQTACHDPFETYVGVAYEKSMYGVMILTPTEDSWAQGDHTITCALESKDDSLITGSLKGATQ